MTTEFNQLRAFLKEMFQFEDHDLDFGIYRIIRLKRQFIETFIDGDGENSLRATVTRALGGLHNAHSEAARNWLASFAATLGDRGSAKWKALDSAPASRAMQDDFRVMLAMASDQERELVEAQLKIFIETRRLSVADLEVRVYNHLLNFFELYYQHGDFGYNTRAASAFKVAYEADYDGSDTLFHWKHKDSYYIKTGNGFHSVRCEIGGQWIEFRLNGSEGEAGSEERNNNKDGTIKHYRLLDVQPEEEIDTQGNPRTLWRVRFALAAASTPKTEIYPRLWRDILADETDLTPYLYKKPGKNDDPPGKPLFNDLGDDFDKTDGGAVKGIGQLRLKFEKYVEELAGRDEFRDFGKNADERKQALERDAVAKALWQLDRNLNRFYVGNDSDYFIHKDLLGFLTREKARFIRQVIFSDLDALLHAGEDNATTLIARAFNIVADTLISFLAAIENFQKGLFELKKKVVDTHYLVSVGKIPATFHQRVLACAAQRDEWREVFKVDVADADQLAAHPTLVVDTSLYRDTDPEFQADLLSLPEFDDLDAQTDGLLINSENWQALNLLQEKFREQIKCIYIDPPYNTGGDGFLYKDSFRHSSWASMIHDRIELAAALANEESFFLSSIDNNEKFNLADVLRISHKFNLVSDISIVNNLKGRQDREHIATAHEHILAYESRKASSFGWDMNESSLDSIYTNTDKDGYRYEARDLRKRGGADTRKERQNLYFPIYWNPTTKIVSLHPIDEDAQEYLPVKSNGEDGCWRWKKETVLDRIEIVQPRLSTKGKLTGFSYRVYFDKVERRKVKPKSIWYEKNYSTDYANKSLKSIVGETGFDTPKSPVLMKNIFEHFSGDDDYVLDFFAGSGSSIHGVMLANNNGRRKVIAIEHGSYFKCILLNRLKRLMFSFCWKNKLPEAGSSYISIFKVQAFEQYEDVLDNLLPAWDDAALPHRVPVSYLYRPERNALSSSLDLSRPFDQTIRVGKKREEKTIDLMETWCYLQGYWIKSRRLYREFDRLYLAVETTHGTLVVFRDIDDAEDDTANLNAILAKYVPEDGSTTLRRLEINHDADLRRLTMDTVLISAADFMRGAQW